MPYTKMNLPDTYSLFSQEGDNLGMASIASMNLSMDLREKIKSQMGLGLPVEVRWNDAFRKYQIVRIMPSGSPITTASFFYHKDL